MRRILKGVVLLSAASCVGAAVEPPARAPEDPRGEVDRGTMVGVLVTRDERLEIHAARGGTRFTVATSGGRVLASRISGPALARRFPALRDVYESAHALHAAVLDASVTLPAARE